MQEKEVMLWPVWGVMELCEPYGGAAAAFWFCDQFPVQTLSAKSCFGALLERINFLQCFFLSLDFKLLDFLREHAFCNYWK